MRTSPELSVLDRACVAFEGPRRPITVAGAESIGEALSICLPRWPRVPVEAPPGGADILVRPRGRGFSVVSPYVERRDGASPPIYAALWVTGGLAAHYVTQSADLVHVHAAAAAFPAGLVVAFGDTMAGKSSLALHLARLGRRCYGDDQLAIDFRPDGPVEGIAFGMAVRVRLPLPDGVAPAHRRYIEERTVYRTRGRAFLRMGKGEGADAGERARIAALVVLERRASGPVRLDAASPAEAAGAILRCGFAPHIDARDLVRRVHAVVRAVPAFVLGFSDSGAAAEALAARFGGVAP